MKFVSVLPFSPLTIFFIEFEYSHTGSCYESEQNKNNDEAKKPIFKLTFTNVFNFNDVFKCVRTTSHNNRRFRVAWCDNDDFCQIKHTNAYGLLHIFTWRIPSFLDKFGNSPLFHFIIFQEKYNVRKNS